MRKLTKVVDGFKMYGRIHHVRPTFMPSEFIDNLNYSKHVIASTLDLIAGKETDQTADETKLERTQQSVNRE